MDLQLKPISMISLVTLLAVSLLPLAAACVSPTLWQLIELLECNSCFFQRGEVNPFVINSSTAPLLM